MVGIEGGAPSLKYNICLINMIVSSPIGRIGRVIYYKFSKIIQNQKFEQIKILNILPIILFIVLNIVGVYY